MAADISGDGSLDVKEFLSYSHPEEDPAMRPHVLAQVHKIQNLISSCPKKNQAKKMGKRHVFWSGLEEEGH